MAGKFKDIREPKDVTWGHIEEAADMREGLYANGEAMPWDEVINRIEASDEDWGSDMESPAIKHLKSEVRRLLRERC